MVTPKAVAVAADVSYIDVLHNTDNTSNYTFSNVNIGDAAADRYVFLEITYASSGGTERSLSSATIGGVAAKIHVDQSVDSSDALSAAIISALVPSGSTANIAISLSGSGGSVDIGIYRVTSLGSDTAFDTAVSTNATGGGLLSTTLDIPAGGFALACANFEINSAMTTWSGVDEMYDEDNTDGSPEIVTGGFASALGAETGRTISATSSSNGGTNNDCVMVAASFA